jgi:hypothetical protein
VARAVLAAPAAAGVVVAAAEVAARHLQYLADMQGVNALLAAKGKAALPPLSASSTAAALQLCHGVMWAAAHSCGAHLFADQAAPEGAQGLHLPVDVEQLVTGSCPQLLVLCETALAADGLCLWQQQPAQHRSTHQQGGRQPTARQQQQTLHLAAAAAATTGMSWEPAWLFSSSQLTDACGD